MGLFDKQQCVMCGKEGRLLDNFDSATGTKCLCSSCERRMHVSGFATACLKYQNKISYEDLLNYQNFYLEKTNEMKGNLNCAVPGVACNMSDIVFDSNVICFPEYEDLMIPSEDVYAVVYVDLPKYSDMTTDAFMLVLFTKNPAVPYYSLIRAGKVSLFSVGTKSKKFRESTFSLLEMNFKGLKYPIGKAKDVKKMIKKDAGYALPVDKKVLLEWLFDAEFTSGNFKPKHADREIPKENWATAYFQNNGIYV